MAGRVRRERERDPACVRRVGWFTRPGAGGVPRSLRAALWTAVGSLERVHEEGFEPAHGTQVAFLHPKRRGGVLVELCRSKRAPR